MMQQFAVYDMWLAIKVNYYVKIRVNRPQQVPPKAEEITEYQNDTKVNCKTFPSIEDHPLVKNNLQYSFLVYASKYI